MSPPPSRADALSTPKQVETWLWEHTFYTPPGDTTSYFGANPFVAEVVLYTVPECRLDVVIGEGASGVYGDLVDAVWRAAGSAAWWFHVTDPDNCLSLLEEVRMWQFDARVPSAHLQTFNDRPAAQGGVAYIGIGPADGSWLLVHELDGEDFTVRFWGAPGVCDAVVAAFTAPATNGRA